MKKIIFTVTVLAAFAAYAAADGGNVITLKAVTDMAAANNPDLIAAEKMARSYESKSHKQFFLENPMVGFDIMGIKDSTLDMDNTMVKYLTISQKIPFPLKYIWKAAGASAESDRYRYMYEMKKLETLENAREAYYELYKTTKYIEITAAAASVMKQVSDIAFVKYNQGAASVQDSARADIESGLLEDSLAGLKRQRETDIQALRKATGNDGFLEQDVFTLEELSVPELKNGFEAIKEMVLKGAPALKAAKAGRSESDNMRDMAISDYIPDLNVQLKKSVVPGSRDYELMVEAEIPVFFLNNQQADIGEKWEMAEAKQNEYISAQNSAVLEAKGHYETIMANARSMNLYKNRLIPQAESGLRSAISSYQSKKTDLISLLDSERMLLDMKKDYYMRLTEYLMHYRMLEELAGEELDK